MEITFAPTNRISSQYRTKSYKNIVKLSDFKHNSIFKLKINANDKNIVDELSNLLDNSDSNASIEFLKKKLKELKKNTIK